MNESDHDLLIRIDQNTKNLLREFRDHKESDEISFKEHNKRISMLEKGLYIGCGAVIIVQWIAVAWLRNNM